LFAKAYVATECRRLSGLSRARVCWIMVAWIIHVVRLLTVLASRHRSLVREPGAAELRLQISGRPE
jgi:hypothetical protein